MISLMISFVNFMRDFVSDFVNGQSELRLWRCNVGRLCWRLCFVRVLVCGGQFGLIMTKDCVETRDAGFRHYISTPNTYFYVPELHIFLMRTDNTLTELPLYQRVINEHMTPQGGHGPAMTNVVQLTDSNGRLHTIISALFSKVFEEPAVNEDDIETDCEDSDDDYDDEL